MTAAAKWVLGVDSGGSGLRVALADSALPAFEERGAGGGGAPGDQPRQRTTTSREPVRTGPQGIDATHLLEQLVPMTRELLDRAGGGELRAIAIGAAGMATLGDDLRATLPG
ncbi:ATPase, partial [Streptomyces sp. T-3]|nr:ATPase [Streptomyces sp. T-3]